MTQRIFRSIFTAAIAVFLAALVLIIGVLYGYFANVQRQQLKMQLALTEQGLAGQGLPFLQEIPAGGYRITWIDADGKVLFDSDSDTAAMENHLQREEISEAFAVGYGESSRYSTTLLERFFYAAQQLPDGTVLRLSVAQSSVLRLILGMLQPICLILLAAVLLAWLLANSSAKKIVQPLNKLNLEEPLQNTAYDELAPLLRRIDSQQKQLFEQQQALVHKQQELATITDNLQEGLILLNQAGQFISINPAAQRLLTVDNPEQGADLLTVCRNLDLQTAVQQALGGHSAEVISSLSAGRYQINAHPVRANGKVQGAAVLLFDITEREKAEQMRREFTANVSHELKTPLHAISGYAELLQNGLVQAQDIIPFAEKIYSETQRLIQLVEDIITLSHLDEGAQGMPCCRVDMYALAADVVQSLTDTAKAAQVSLHLSGKPAVMQGIPQLLQSIIYNLCENAIKYNHPGGSVNVKIEPQDKEILLTVADDGIGIASEHQQRIFERFYRVDKSHSKKIGGTGLGLSIVKYAALAHNAKIKVESQVNQGTSITIQFLE